jgi:nicotinamide-nucleotide amidase
MKTMMTERVIPRLKTMFALPVICHKVIRTAGIGESMLADKIADWEKSLPDHIKLAYLPSLGEVKLRLTGFGNQEAAMRKELDQYTTTLLEKAGAYIYGYGEEPLESVLGHTLREKKLTLAIAESCTGGYLSHLITSIPGSSDYFMGSMIPYSYEIKMLQLGVSLIMVHRKTPLKQAIRYIHNIQKKSQSLIKPLYARYNLEIYYMI